MKVLKDMRCLGEMIKHNSLKGLLEYYKEAKERLTLPDKVEEPMVSETTEAIREIDLLQAIDDSELPQTIKVCGFCQMVHQTKYSETDTTIFRS